MYSDDVSEIRIAPCRNNQGHIGFCSFVLFDSIRIGSVAIFTRLDGDGIRLVYPKKSQVNCAYPINKQLGEKINRAVTLEYQRLFENVTNYHELST